MKTIHLLRHAKSSRDHDVPDIERPLAPRGVRDAQALANELGRQAFVVDRILCSTARRARETLAPLATLLGDSVDIRYDPRLLDASAKGLRRIVTARSRGVKSILVVGHNPGLEAYLEAIDLHGDESVVVALRSHVPTCTLVTLALDVHSAKGKLIRAMRARHGAIVRDFRTTRAKPVAATRVRLERGTPRDEAAATVLDAVRRHAFGNLRGAEDGVTECVHQLRISLRRARVALSIFRKELGSSSVPLRTELRWLGRALGALRDAQVLAAAIGDSANLPGLSQAIAAYVAQQERRARTAIRSKRGRAALRSLRELEPRRGASSKPFEKLARVRIAKRATAVLERWDALESGRPSAVHELRKELKKLRYAIVMLEGDDADGLVRALGRMQDELGARQDPATSEQLFEQRLAPRLALDVRRRARETLRASFGVDAIANTDFSAIRSSLVELARA